MIAGFPHLIDFFSSYFNQDWTSDYANELELITSFKGDSDIRVESTIEDLTNFLKSVPTNIIDSDSILNMFGGYCDPSSAGLSNSEWLVWLLKQMQKTDETDENS